MKQEFTSTNLATSVNVLNAPSNSIHVSPNPSNGQITVSYSLSSSGSVRFSLVDELGQVVYDNTINSYQPSANSHQLQLNLESLATGIYTLRMQTSGGSTVRKVVIMKK